MCCYSLFILLQLVISVRFYSGKNVLLSKNNKMRLFFTLNCAIFIDEAKIIFPRRNWVPQLHPLISRNIVVFFKQGSSVEFMFCVFKRIDKATPVYYTVGRGLL